MGQGAGQDPLLRCSSGVQWIVLEMCKQEGDGLSLVCSRGQGETLRSPREGHGLGATWLELGAAVENSEGVERRLGGI